MMSAAMKPTLCRCSAYLRARIAEADPELHRVSSRSQERRREEPPALTLDAACAERSRPRQLGEGRDLASFVAALGGGFAAFAFGAFLAFDGRDLASAAAALPLPRPSSPTGRRSSRR